MRCTAVEGGKQVELRLLKGIDLVLGHYLLLLDPYIVLKGMRNALLQRPGLFLGKKGKRTQHKDNAQRKDLSFHSSVKYLFPGPV